MLQAIREKAQGVFAWIIVTIIVIPFALWGVQEYVGVSSNTVVASVNGEDISENDLQSAFQMQRQRMQQMFGARFSQFINEKQLKQQVLDSLIEERVIRQAINSYGYRIDKEQVIASIYSISAFRKDGKFDTQTYKEKLKWQGMSAQMFERKVQQSLITEQFVEGIKNTSFITDYIENQFQALKNQQRSFDYFIVPVSEFIKDIKLSDADIEQYYQDRKENYREPEKVKVQYVSLNTENIAENISIDIEKLKKAYNDKKESYKTEETRKVSHILFQIDKDPTDEQLAEVKKQATAILEKIKNGADFEEMAKQHSKDPVSAMEGGYLGFISKGQMVPEFEKVAFQLEVDTLSDLVKSKFGYHIIKVHEIKPEITQTFESVKAELEKELKVEEAEKIFYEKSEPLGNISYEQTDSLDNVSKELDLKIEESEWFTRSNGKGISDNQKFRDAAYSTEVLNDKNNSEVLELGTGHAVVLRVAGHKPSFIKAKADVIKDLQEKLTLEKAKILAREKGEKLFNDAAKSIALLASENLYELKKVENIKRENSDVPSMLVQTAFKLKHPEDEKLVIGKTVLAGGDFSILALKAVTNGMFKTKTKTKVNDDANDNKKEINKEKADNISTETKKIADSTSKNELDAVVSYLRALSDIDINKNAK